MITGLTCLGILPISKQTKLFSKSILVCLLRKENTPSTNEPSNPKNNLNQNEPKNNSPSKTETAAGKMTKEEAEQRLSVLTEDLKQFQRKQALEMKSLFTYQGNDW